MNSMLGLRIPTRTLNPPGVFARLFYSIPAGGNGNSADAVSSAPRELVHVKTIGEWGASVGKGRPTLVDFYADWCAPCRQMTPIVKKVSLLYPHITFAKIDIENTDQDVESKIKDLGITGIPAFFLFDKEGKLKANFMGAKSEKDLRQWLDGHV